MTLHSARFSLWLSLSVIATYALNAQAEDEWPRLCFPKELVTYRCLTPWYDDHDQVFYTDLDMTARKSPLGPLHSYSFSRAVEPNLCQRHLREFRRLSQGMAEICLDGQSGSSDPDDRDYIWRRFVTSQGKDSYFAE